MSAKKDIPRFEVEAIHAEIKRILSTKETLSREEALSLKRRLKELLLK